MGTSRIRYQEVRKFGRNQAVGTSYVPVVSSGAVAGFLPSAAAATTVVSTDPNDTILGTGARTVVVEGVDSTGEYVTETVDLNGGTTAALAVEFLFIHRAYVIAAGTSHVNEGIVTINHGATVIAQIDAGWSQTEIAAFYVNDADCGIEILQIRVNAHGGNATNIDIQFWIKNRATGVETMIGMANVHGTSMPSTAIKPSLSSQIPPGHYFWAEARVGATTADVGCGFDFRFI